MLLTRHNDGHTKGQHGDFAPCARVLDLRRTAAQHIPGHTRLAQALAVACTCGAGDSEGERSSLEHVKEA